MKTKNDKLDHAQPGKGDTVASAFTDTQLLDYLQKEVAENGPLVLHDGYADCGKNRGLACIPGGLTGRTLRKAIHDMMPGSAR